MFLYQESQNELYKEMAVNALDFFAKEMIDENGPYHFYKEGKKGVQGSLLDSSNLLLAFVQAYEVLGEETYLEVAKDLADHSLSELYDWNGEIYSQELIFTELHENIELDLFNYPNPFSNHTIIQFNLPVETAYQLIFRDVSGKEVKAISAVGNKGLNEVIFNANEVPNTGIIFYELKTEETSIIKKMVMIN